MPSPRSALLVIDMLNPYDHEDADRLSGSVIKARHTVFYGTPLEYLLGQKEIGRLVLTGQVTEQCILYSALDAYARHLEVCVPRDGVAHTDEDLAEASLRMMERNMDAEICDAKEVEWRR